MAVLDLQEVADAIKTYLLAQGFKFDPRLSVEIYLNGPYWVALVDDIGVKGHSRGGSYLLASLEHYAVYGKIG